MADEHIPVLSTRQCQGFLVLACNRARSQGLSQDDAEDCASAFVEHLLIQINTDPQTTLPRLQSWLWLGRCADNWAKNYARQQRRRDAYEQPWPREAFEQDASPAQELFCTLPNPEQQILSRELANRLDIALSQLLPRQQELFQCHCIDGETLVSIAHSTHRSPEAVRQALCQLRRRLQALLMRTGLSQQEAMDYLYQMLTVPL